MEYGWNDDWQEEEKEVPTAKFAVFGA